MTLKGVLRHALGKPGHGVNIEGLAAKDGMLYFGFREPAKDKHTYILPVRADQLFSAAGVPNAEPVKIKAGAGRGIRDMLAVPEGGSGFKPSDPKTVPVAGHHRRQTRGSGHA